MYENGTDQAIEDRKMLALPVWQAQQEVNVGGWEDAIGLNRQSFDKANIFFSGYSGSKKEKVLFTVSFT